MSRQGRAMAVDPETLPYRPCVGIVILNRNGFVWAGRRIVETDTELAGSAQLWQMPQGGIDKGEQPLEAAKREMFEETGIRTATMLAQTPGWIHYDLPRNLVGLAFNGKYRGQTQKWFAFRFDGDESEIEINPPPGGQIAEFDRWEWKRLAEMPDLIVPFKRGVYEEVLAAFRHLVA